MHVLQSTSLRIRLGGLLALVACVVLGGAPAASAAPSAAKDAKTKSVEVIAAKAYAQTVLKPRKGRVVVVNFWATWCAPCVKELPEFEAAAKKLKPAGVDVVLVSADGADAAKSRVPAFLKKRGISLPVYVNADVDPEELIAIVDPAWSGALPYTVIYDGAGQRVAALAGAQTEKSIVDAAHSAQGGKKK